ncbi:MAG: hypothetical protein Q4A36_03975 [Candidatus Saccharibacteria bacterium]|nr:hypothetical protein [Candidatus Saccharibacteria bacterium]
MNPEINHREPEQNNSSEWDNLSSAENKIFNPSSSEQTKNLRNIISEKIKNNVKVKKAFAVVALAAMATASGVVGTSASYTAITAETPDNNEAESGAEAILLSPSVVLEDNTEFWMDFTEKELESSESFADVMNTVLRDDRIRHDIKKLGYPNNNTTVDRRIGKIDGDAKGRFVRVEKFTAIPQTTEEKNDTYGPGVKLKNGQMAWVCDYNINRRWAGIEPEEDELVNPPKSFFSHADIEAIIRAAEEAARAQDEASRLEAEQTIRAVEEAARARDEAAQQAANEAAARAAEEAARARDEASRPEAEQTIRAVEEAEGHGYSDDTDRERAEYFSHSNF